MFQGITHRGSLKGKDFLLNEYFRGIVAFENHLGPVFIKVSNSFSTKRKAELIEFLEKLPKDLQFFVEVRHPDWFQPKVAEEFFEQLYNMNIGAVITDTAGRRDCAHMYTTLPKTFIWYVGNSLHETDFSRIDGWVKRKKRWLNNGMKEIYFFMHMHDEALSPELTVYLNEKLNKECDLHLQVPVFITETEGLKLVRKKLKEKSKS